MNAIPQPDVRIIAFNCTYSTLMRSETMRYDPDVQSLESQTFQASETSKNRCLVFSAGISNTFKVTVFNLDTQFS
jgi:hypothetical protein